MMGCQRHINTTCKMEIAHRAHKIDVKLADLRWRTNNHSLTPAMFMGFLDRFAECTEEQNKDFWANSEHRARSA
eukprot:SAG11_NODE_6015_length_1409_cov_2.209160_2_plen_74_part_00